MATSSFKNERTTRVGSTNTTYMSGMKYSNDPLPEGYCKTIVNYDITDDGDTLAPRHGYQSLNVKSISYDEDTPFIHHISNVYYTNEHDDTIDLVRYILIGKKTEDGRGIYLDDAILLDDDRLDGAAFGAELDESQEEGWVLLNRDNSGWDSIHGMDIQTPEQEGIFAKVNNENYVFYEDASGVRHIGMLVYNSDIYYNTRFKIVEVVPEEISAAEAVNYGYNMLDDDPYVFDNEETATGSLLLLGILPYDPVTNELEFSSNVGKDIKFTCTYQWPTAHANLKYKVQWETKDLTQLNSDVIVQQYVADSPEYTPGDEVSLVYKAPFKQFTVIVKFYLSTDTTQPIKVMQLPAYYLSADGKGSTYGMDPVNYDLTTATHMASWKGRLILWGVEGAETILFTSALNNPAFFPFPQYIDIFDERIIGAIPYLGSLMVFTESTLIRVDVDEEYNYLTHTVVQERLSLSKYDVNTIILVKNMIYFKSNDKYYLIVPKTDSSVTNAVQLAPISTPISYLLDHFEESIQDIIYDMYELEESEDAVYEPYDIQLMYYHNYLEKDEIRNVYKLKVKESSSGKGFYVDFMLIYDTLTRNWRIHIVQVSKRRMLPYKQSVSDNTIFINIAKFTVPYTIWKLQTIQQSKSLVEDSIALDYNWPPFYQNYQLLDTGYSDNSNTNKKRFRELQLSIDQTDKVPLEFYTGFYVDDLNTKAMYDYQVTRPYDEYGYPTNTIYVERILSEPSTISGPTRLDSSSWSLGSSRLGETSVTKVRISVSGKGYAGRLKLLSRNLNMYRILNNTWVYRLMNMR